MGQSERSRGSGLHSPVVPLRQSAQESLSKSVLVLRSGFGRGLMNRAQRQANAVLQRVEVRQSGERGQYGRGDGADSEVLVRVFCGDNG